MRQITGIFLVLTLAACGSGYVPSNGANKHTTQPAPAEPVTLTTPQLEQPEPEPEVESIQSDEWPDPTRPRPTVVDLPPLGPVDPITELRKLLQAGDPEKFEARKAEINDRLDAEGSPFIIVAVTEQTVTYRTRDGKEFTTTMWTDALPPG